MSGQVLHTRRKAGSGGAVSYARTFRFSLSALCLVAVVLLTGCHDENHITVEPGQLVGCWQVTGTQEYWRYRSDYSGVTWDESEDISEEESNLTYTWTINGDELTHVFSGEMGNQAVPKVYTVTSISANAMEWKDIYGMTKTFNKVN